MSEILFAKLGLSKPDMNLEVGSGSHAQQTARVIRFENVLDESRAGSCSRLRRCQFYPTGNCSAFMK
jgi:hypothetical protein